MPPITAGTDTSVHADPWQRRTGRAGGPALLVVLSASALAAQVFPGLAAALEVDRTALLGGEAWRLLTCHLAHFGWEHLFWSGIVFVVLGWAAASRSAGRFVLALVLAGAAIPAAILLFEADLDRYRGLSGLDSALFGLVVVLVARDFAREGNRKGLVLAALAAFAFASKLLFELATGAAVFVDAQAAGFRPVPLAHVVGLLAGALAGVLPARGPLVSGNQSGNSAMMATWRP